MKDLSKVFFNSVEEMNECYGVDAKLPNGLHKNTDLVCYEIVEPSICEYLGQYVFTKVGFYHLDNLGKHVIPDYNEVTLESEVYEDDTFEYEGRCFVYVRVNDYLRKHTEKTIIGCEFVCSYGWKYKSYRRFADSVELSNGCSMCVIDQDGYNSPLNSILLYPDDHSDPIPYQEWVKKINEQEEED